MIQDIVFMVGGFILLLTLLPMFKFGAPRWTSVPIAVVMFVFALNAATLGLVLTVISYGLTCLGWTYIALFKAKRETK
jgi:hypothetical protein